MYIMYAQYISHQICTVHCYSSPGYGTLPSICTVHCLVIPPLGKPGTVHSPLYMYSTLFSYPSLGQARYGTLPSIYVQYTVQLSLPWASQVRYINLYTYTVHCLVIPPRASQVRYIHLYICTVHCLVIPSLGKPGTLH